MGWHKRNLTDSFFHLRSDVQGGHGTGPTASLTWDSHSDSHGDIALSGLSGFGLDPELPTDSSLTDNSSTSSSAPLTSTSSPVGDSFSTAVMTPDWVHTVDEIRLILKSIKDSIAELHTLHQQHLKPTLMSDRDAEETAIFQLHSQLTKLFRAARARLLHLDPKVVRQRQRDTAKMKRKAHRRAGYDISSDDEDDIDIDSPPKEQMDFILENIQQQFARKLQDLSLLFKKDQRIYLNALKEQQMGSTLGTSSTTALDAVLSDMGGGQLGVGRDPGFSDGQRSLVATMEVDVRQRSKEIQNVLTAINDMSTIMEDIASLVHDQGQMVESIDYNISRVLEHTEGALHETRKANKYQIAYRKKICIILLIVSIVTLFVVYFVA